MSICRFVYLDLLRFFKSVYVWILLAVSFSVIALSAGLTYFELSLIDGKIDDFSTLSSQISRFPDVVVSIFIPILGALFISRDFVSGYILRSSLLCGGWQRLFFLRAIVIAILSAVFTVLNIVFSLGALVFVLGSHGYLDDAFTLGVFLSFAANIPVSIIVGLMAYFFCFAFRGAAVFLSVYFPVVYFLNGLLRFVPYYNYFSYSEAIGTATRFVPLSATEIVQVDLGHIHPYNTSPYVAFAVLLLYCAIAFSVAYFRNTRRNGIL